MEETSKKIIWQTTKKILSIVGKILEWFIFTILIIVFFVVLSPVLPTKRYIYTYIVATGSMEPAIKAGSVALVKPAKIEALKKGDIITFTSPKDPNKTIIHRIYEIKQTGKSKNFITKGDNNNSADSWNVSTVLVKGQFITSIPLLGHPAALLKTKKGFILMVILPAILLILLQIKTIREGIDEEVKKRTKKAIEEAKKNHTYLASVILCFVISSFLFSGMRVVHALYISTVTVSGLAFSVKDFVPPPVPILRSPPDNTIMDSTHLTQTWTKVTDAEGSNPVTYYYESCNVDPLLHGGVCTSIRYAQTFTVLDTELIGTEERIVKHAEGAPNGILWWRVRAIDSAGNISVWSEVWKLTILNTPPAPSNLGWNLQVGSSAPNERPLDLECIAVTNGGGDPSHLLAAHNWGSVAGSNIKYQRRWKAPGGGWTTDATIYTNTYTPFSSFGSDMGTEGQWNTQVRALIDVNNDNVSDTGEYSPWSNECKITLDRTPPSSIITVPGNSGPDTSISIYTGSWDGLIAGTASDAISGIHHVELSINLATGSTNAYWDGSNWVAGSETATRVHATGTTNWTYNIPSPASGTYTIIAHAVDNAGNIENSYKIIIVSEPEPVIQPEANFVLANTKDSVSFSVSHIKPFKKITYKIIGLTGNKTLAEYTEELNGRDEFKADGIILSTCSDGVCTQLHEISNILLQVVFEDARGNLTTLEKTL